jgi:hypothetical protein
MTAALPLERLQAYRRQTFRLDESARVRDVEAAVQFVEQRGFAYFWPIRDVLLPSLWVAVAGDRPVPDEHDDPGHVTWGWKDSLLGKRRWYYAKVLRKKSTLISLDVLPYFYALSQNFGDPQEDHLVLYEQGRLTQEARAVYEALLDHGPLDTIALRRAARLSSPESESRFGRALSELQADFKILPVGVAEAGAWRYAFIYEITPRHFPDLIERTRFIDDQAARRRLAELYFRSLGAAQAKDLARLFGWRPEEVRAALDGLARDGVLRGGLSLPGQPGEWLALAEL